MPVTRQTAVQRGDTVLVSGRHVGEPARTGEIVDVIGDPGHPHFTVRWRDGHESILYPGETTSVRPRADARPPAPGTALLIDALRAGGRACELLPHRRTTSASGEARVLGLVPQAVAKTIVGRSEADTSIRAVVPASMRLDVAKLAAAIAARDVRLLDEQELVSSYPQFEPGAVPPFGGPAGDTVVVDGSLVGNEYVVFEGGTHEMSMRMRTDDLVEIAGAQVADIAAGREEAS